MSASAPAFLGRRFDQLCFVVDDLEEAVDYWTRVNGVARWSINYDLATGQEDKRYWGQPGDFQFSCAYAFAGDTLIELARHDGGRSVYKDWLDERGTGPHHVGFRLADAGEYEQAAQHFQVLNIRNAMTGFARVDGGACRWGYFDTRAFLGCYTELYYLEGSALRQLHEFKSGESDHMIPTLKPA